MTNETTSSPQSAAKLPLMSGRSVLLFVVIAALWCLLSWLVVDRVVQNRISALVGRELNQAQQDVSSISENFERVLNRLQGLPAVLAGGSDIRAVLGSFGAGAAPSPLAREERVVAWTRRADLNSLNKLLLDVAGEMDVDIIWVMNAAGDCVASSNFGDTTTFIGTNYADRAYFKS